MSPKLNEFGQEPAQKDSAPSLLNPHRTPGMQCD